MIFKKIILALSILMLGFSFSYALVAAEEEISTAPTAAQSNEQQNNNNDISSENFQINVWNITPTDASRLTTDWGNSEDLIQNTLGLIIEKLITAFWVLSLLVMTIGAGFMIIYHGQDELLTRWKSIFSYGLISLAVALSAWLLVNFVSYLLYWS